jgi:predicted DNA binding CopG/RHH family protein
MDKNELVKKMKRGEIGFIDDPAEEKEVWEAFKKIPDANVEERKKELQEIARATLEKNKRISILVNERDLFELKAKALETGFSYQTLITALIHNYVTGKISLTV